MRRGGRGAAALRSAAEQDGRLHSPGDEDRSDRTGPRRDRRQVCGRRRWAALIAIAPIAVALSAPPANAAVATVTIRDNRFDPKEITIRPGDSVEWVHSGQNLHTVTADDASFDSSPLCLVPLLGNCLSNGQSYRITFPTVGSTSYYCKIHGGVGGQGMSGVIVVAVPAAPSPSPSPTVRRTPLPTLSPTPSRSPSPSPSPSLSPSPLLVPSLSPSPALLPPHPPSPSPSLSPTSPREGSSSGPPVIAAVGLVIAVASAVGLWWLRRRVRA